MSRPRWAALAALVLLPTMATNAAAQQKITPPPPPPPPDLNISAAIQARTRVDIRPDGTFDGNPDALVRVTNRLRAGLKLDIGIVSAFAQVMDVRNWGTEVTADGEQGTLADFVADGFDLHQGYGQITSPFGLWLRIGRQEIRWHGQRILGANGWHPAGRSFDAARLVFDRDEGYGEAFYALILDRPTDENDPASREEDMHLFGVRGGPRLAELLFLDGLALVRTDAGRDEVIATVGAYAKGKAGPFRWMLEGYAQVGERVDVPIAAGMFGLRAGVDVPSAAGLYLGGGLDLLSGDDDNADGLFTTFDTLFAANHGVYGHMDRYLNIPRDTRGQGLLDGMLNVSIKPVTPLKLTLDVHVFAGPWAEEDAKLHGVELDTGLHFKPAPPVTFSTGFWVYVPGAWQGVEGGLPEIAGYLMADFQLK